MWDRWHNTDDIAIGTAIGIFAGAMAWRHYVALRKSGHAPSTGAARLESQERARTQMKTWFKTVGAGLFGEKKHKHKKHVEMVDASLTQPLREGALVAASANQHPPAALLTPKALSQYTGLSNGEYPPAGVSPVTPAMPSPSLVPLLQADSSPMADLNLPKQSSVKQGVPFFERFFRAAAEDTTPKEQARMQSQLPSTPVLSSLVAAAASSPADSTQRGHIRSSSSLPDATTGAVLAVDTSPGAGFLSSSGGTPSVSESSGASPVAVAPLGASASGSGVNKAKVSPMAFDSSDRSVSMVDAPPLQPRSAGDSDRSATAGVSPVASDGAGVGSIAGRSPADRAPAGVVRRAPSTGSRLPGSAPAVSSPLSKQVFRS